MNRPRYVFLDPDGTIADWLFVVVAAETGIVYQHQYGGTGCRQGKVEGYLVPVDGAAALTGLCELFQRHFRGAGTWGYAWDENADRDRLRSLVDHIVFWSTDGTTDEAHRLRLDESRIREADEAWVPVLTPDGPGVLMWPNSD